MSKGSYLGGHSVVGFSGTFLGRKREKLVQATDLDPHLTQKEARNNARKAAGKGGKKKKIHLSKAEKKAENQARKQYRKAPKEVIVEHLRQGEVISTRTIKRS